MSELITKDTSCVMNQSNDDAQNAQNELTNLNQYINEKEERLKLKIDLRSKNQSGYVDQYRLDDSVLKKLDSSIKKVTSFIKRLKTLTESQKDSLSKDMSQLNLSKYLSEVAAAFLEAKLKMNDVQTALHLCSQMHQSYAEFSQILFEQWQKLLNLKKEDKVTNPSKMRVDLRLFAELITIGVLPEKESLSLLGNQLTVLTTYDKDHSNISIITSFCKHCGEDFADLVPLKYEKLSEKMNIKIVRNSMYSIDRQKAVKCLFREYFRSLCQHLLNEHKEIQKLEAQNKKSYQTKGEINSEKKEKYEQALSNYKKLIENTETLADLLGEQMPELPQDETNKKDDDMINIDVYLPNKNDDFDSNTSPWEDEETRQFYECIPDIKSLIPGILYKDINQQSKEAIQKNESTKQEEEITNPDDISVEMAKIEREIQELEIETNLTNQEDQSQQQPQLQQQGTDSLIVVDEKDELNEEQSQSNSNISNQQSGQLQQQQQQQTQQSLSGANMKALMDSFVNQLPNCVNRELIDKAAKEFCMNINTKLNRKRLIRALFEVQRTRLDLLPFYARFVATLNPIIPEISIDLSSLLLNDFRFHVRKKDQINIESKIKVSRFIGELVKFNMFSKLECLNCLKTLLADFRHHNIEMFCNLLDVCGRFLYRNKETHMKLKLLLEILMRKKQAAMSMDSRYSIMIENAFYYCNPPENKQIEKKILSPLHEYIKKILYKDLNKLCVEKILRQMRKLNWTDEELKDYTIKCLISAWNVRYNSIHCLANLVSGLALYYEDIGIQIVDGVIEDIRLGLEVNLPKFNQRRVSMVKYLGELYNYRMVESSIIFKTLYTLITFGVSFDVNEVQNSETSLDPVDNFFRVRLVCVLLDTCGQYFDRGSTKKKLDCFLNYFQRYYLFKKETSLGQELSRPFDPVDVEFVFTETINSLRSDFKYLKTYKDSCDEVNKMESEIKENLLKTSPALIKHFNSTNNSNEQDQSSLGTIKEDEEAFESQEQEIEYNNNQDEDDNDEYDENINRHNKEDDDDGDGDDEDRDDEYYNERERNDSQTQEGSSSDVDDGIRIVQPRTNTQQLSKEDDEFMKAFDSLVTENIAQRTKETIKMPSVDISVPMVSKKIKSLTQTEHQEQDNEMVKLAAFKDLMSPNKTELRENEMNKITNSAQMNEQKNKSFNFVLMLKKGNKTQYQNMQVPVNSEFASQFKAREELERAEKEKLKQLTLNINERIEQEEFQQEMIQTGNYGQFKSSSNSSSIYSSNTNRDRHKYNHPKGVPDIDLIFGTSTTNTNSNSSFNNSNQRRLNQNERGYGK